MRKTIILLAATLVLAACQETLEERAAREAREVTEAKCPMPIGDNMFLDSVVFDIPSRTQSQYFRFTGESDNDSVVTFLSDAKNVLVKELKNTPNYKALMKAGVNFHYVYRSTNNPQKVYLETTITPEDYQ
ncbi:MAG: lipoprotein [Prevotella sp.]|nr:lipoprotein [Prevotella sp.]